MAAKCKLTTSSSDSTKSMQELQIVLHRLTSGVYSEEFTIVGKYFGGGGGGGALAPTRHCNELELAIVCSQHQFQEAS